MQMFQYDVLNWWCNMCGHNWPVRDKEQPPTHCAKCHHRGWNREREIEVEC